VSVALCTPVELRGLKFLLSLLLRKYSAAANNIAIANIPVPAPTPAFAPGVKVDEGLTG
jgi:hypothetical protein